MLQKMYEIYAEAAKKNPVHTPEMLMWTEGFEANLSGGKVMRGVETTCFAFKL